MENLNSVCYVTRVNEIKPIEGADNIELIVAGGWNCISKKGEFTTDDQVIVAVTDAIIPFELSEAMGVTNYLRKDGRVRTIKLRGVYSECLIVPFKYTKTKYYNDGADMMDTLKVFKYEPPVKMVQLSGGRKVKYKANANFHVYYKFPNLKNVPNLFNENDEVEITRKIHGTNARYGIVLKSKLSLWDRFKKFIGLADEWINYEFVYGSHNVEKGSDTQGFYDTDVWRTIAHRHDIKSRLWEFIKIHHTIEELGTGIVLYGEIYGKGIQKNYEYGLDDIKFVGFDIEINGKYLPVHESDVGFAILKLDYVPILYRGFWSQKVQDAFTFNQFIDNSKVPHEGIVIKEYSGDRHKVAKVINPDYHIYAEKKDVGDSH